APYVSAQEHALAGAVKTRVRIADIGDGQIGVGDAAIDMIVFLPEAALELQADLDGRGIGYRRDGGGQGWSDIHGNLREDGQRNRTKAPIGPSFELGAGRAGVFVHNTHAGIVLLDIGD